MGNVGLPELIIIFTIALIVFGPRKLPELGKSLGKSIAEFKKASNELKNTLDEEIRSEERKTSEQQRISVSHGARALPQRHARRRRGSRTARRLRQDVVSGAPRRAPEAADLHRL